MDDQLRLDRQLTDFFAEAKATSLTPDEREHCRFAIESHLIAQSVSLTAEGRLDGMAHGRESSALSGVSLDERERRQLRKNLVSFMQQNPRYIPDAEVETFSLYRIFELAFPRFALGVLMFVGVGASVTFASQASVPGDFLYSFKVNVYEPVVSKLATSDTSQAVWEARRAQNRLKEAAKLAEESKLTDEAAADLRLHFQKHLEKTQRNIDTLQANGDVDVATSIQTSLNTYLESNSEIVRKISRGGHDDPSVGVAAIKEQPSSDDNKNGHAKKPSSSRGYSLIETVQTILNTQQSSSTTKEKKKDGDSSSETEVSSSKNDEHSSSSRPAEAKSSVAASVESHEDEDEDGEIDGEADLGSQVSSAASLVPALFNDIMQATSSAVPPLPDLLP